LIDFLSSLTGLDSAFGTIPSHKWLGYFRKEERCPAMNGWAIFGDRAGGIATLQFGRRVRGFCRKGVSSARHAGNAVFVRGEFVLM
jgi:hypothetical protein